MIFARKADDHLASLVKQLDKAIAKNKSKKLAAFVNLLGDDRESLEADAKKFAGENKIENVPIVVPVEFENGPANYGVNPEAETTVLVYVGLVVKANHALPAGGLDEEATKAILGDLPKILE
jgi:hypothetical protein